MTQYLELVCPAGSPAALRAAIEAGADTVYCSYNDRTNARNYPGLNFDVEEMAEGVAYAHKKGAKVLIAINTFPPAGQMKDWQAAVDNAAAAGADAVILADLGVLDYAMRKHPNLRRHLSVQGSAASSLSINFFRDQFDIKRVVLPRVLSVEEVAKVVEETGLEIEVFAYGSVGPMSEGRCFLSSYMTGLSPTSEGAWRQQATSTIARTAINSLLPWRCGPEPGKQERARRLSNALQGALRDSRKRLLSLRGADRAQRYRHSRRVEEGRRDGAQDRGSPAQPRLCERSGERFPQGGRCGGRRRSRVNRSLEPLRRQAADDGCI